MGSRTEWVGGHITMRARITSEGPAFQPEALFWITGKGIVAGTKIFGTGSRATELAEARMRPYRRRLWERGQPISEPCEPLDESVRDLRIAPAVPFVGCIELGAGSLV